MKAYIKTFGCQMNVQDSLQMKGLLSKIGYTSTEVVDEADLALLVTCSIREKAEDKVYSDLGRLRVLLVDKPHLIVGVAGCVAQQEKEKLIKRFPFLDLVFGPDAISELPAMIQEARKNKESARHRSILKTKFHPRDDFEFVNLLYNGEENRVRATVNIQKGCDNICSYCIVPQVRGREVSRPSNQIIEEINALVERGVQDVTLLGQNVNSYGLKSVGEISFAGLLEKIATKTKLKRLHFTTSHPKDVGDDLIDAFRHLSVLCPHLHLPIQSGSDRILKAMRRQYTIAHYLNVIEKLKNARPDFAFSTDFIVGFPGETREDFDQTIHILETVGFDASFLFTYSPRPKTTAAELCDDVSDDEKRDRLDELLELQRKIAREKNQKLEGRNVEVLVEGYNPVDKKWMGRTDTNKITHFVDKSNKIREKDLSGLFIQVTITKGNSHSLVGECIG